MDFQISKVISPETVDLNATEFKDKDELFIHMVSLFKKAGKINSKKLFLQSLYERENIGSTYMGNNIAIPHGKSETVNSPGITFCRSKDGILYESNGEKGIAKLIFMLAIPKSTASEDYIRILSTLARLLMYKEFNESLYCANDYNDVIKAIKATEKILIND